ncbi:LysE family translocator [Crenobacter cavernae]|uniref:LysE family translocator n=1 Tax=Crenobacter cavernae TaxID=2290923 RepID=A0A345Y4G0_9NEIS|nr:LysE family translocator [Crenobacter cavernae]AXK38812.1 LysE family translocator [Crenobacter cavernae]
MTLIAFEQALAFLAAAILITLSPGPDNLMVLGMGASRGRAAGVAFGLGCATGCLTHTLLAALGVSALIAASPVAFTALKVAGGAYLIYLGVMALRSRGAAQSGALLPEASLARLFARGLVANAINPKVALFFLAFLPQFVSAGAGAPGWQIAQLGVLFTLQAALLFSLLGLAAGRVGAWLARTPAAARWLDRVAGTIFAALGLRLIVCR